MQNNPVLVEVYRAGVLESFHRGAICVVDQDNTIVYSEGDAHQVCYPRSSLKLFQVIPLIESGAADHYGFTTEELAIMCGSHNGEQEHLRVVNSILSKIGLEKNALQCGPQYPTLSADRKALYKTETAPEHLHNNCSGKHAGFLALCQYLKLSTEDYLDAEHPTQQMILDVAEEMYEHPREKMTTALDGCSAPIFSIPLFNQAVAYKNLVHPVKFNQKRQDACARIVQAIQEHPFMVAGSKRYCTDMMRICGDRIIGKTGAEGVYALGLLQEHLGCAIKIDDGKMQPQYHVAQKLIESTGIFSKETLAPLAHYMAEPLYNYNKLETGIMEVNQSLFTRPLF